MDTIRIILTDWHNWRKLLTWTSGRLLPPEQRSACAQQPGDIAWISSDATLERIACISWEDEEYCAMDDARLVRQFKRGSSEDCVIAECEVIVVLISATTWSRGVKSALRAPPPTPHPPTTSMDPIGGANGAPNRALRIPSFLKDLIDFLFGEEIGIIPRYVRSGHNISPDCLTRCTDQNVTDWVDQNGMLRAWAPKERPDVSNKWGPELDFSTLVRFRAPELVDRLGHRLSC